MQGKTAGQTRGSHLGARKGIAVESEVSAAVRARTAPTRWSSRVATSAIGGGINRSTQHFCDTQSAWQHCSNENVNDLLRHYFPKGADLSGHSRGHPNKAACQQNKRPRKTLGAPSRWCCVDRLTSQSKPTLVGVTCRRQYRRPEAGFKTAQCIRPRLRGGALAFAPNLRKTLLRSPRISGRTSWPMTSISSSQIAAQF